MMTIRKKLITMQIITAFVVLVLASAVFVHNEIGLFREALVTKLTAMATLIGENTGSTLLFMDSQSATEVLKSLQVEQNIVNACIYDVDGSVFAAFSREGDEDSAFPELEGDVAGTGHAFREGYLELLHPIGRNNEVVGTVFLRSDLQQLRDNIDGFYKDAAGILVIGMLLSGMLSILLQRAISRPIRELAEVAKTVTDTGDYGQRVKPRSGDELGTLSAAFNEMLELIQKRDASLQEARETLENRVAERTQELQVAKDQLEASLEAAQEARSAAEVAKAAAEVARSEAESAKEAAEGATAVAEDANRTKSTFLANMSHEIRTPMNAILGYAQILQSDSELSAEQRKAIDTIGESGNHLLGLINSILDISKIEAGREELNMIEFDLNGLVQGLGMMFEMRCWEKGLRWNLDCDTPAKLALGDEGKLRQVLINMLGNAVKFTEKGDVSMFVEARPQSVHFEVSDTGPGIPSERHAAVFEPFHQESESSGLGGTGLGLAIARQHVEMMDGELKVESVVGQGSRFFFELPVDFVDTPTSQVSEAAWSNVEHLAEGVSVRALVVDDVETNRDILSKMLSNLGVDVDSVSGGTEALAQVRRRRPDIIFMDIRMPGMDGVETLQHLLEEYGPDAMAIVAVSASVFKHEQETYDEAGFDSFIDKPLRSEQVYRALSRLTKAQFTYASPPEQSPAQPVDTSQVVLPEALYNTLVEAAGNHSVSDLRRGLKELEALGGLSQHLASQLRTFGDRYDMAAISKVLHETSHQ